MPPQLKMLAGFLVCCCFYKAYAQQQSYPFTRIDITKGLSHNRVTCIYKDHKGFMWFGTIAGLNRYDGHSFKVFIHDAQDTFSLADDCIARIYELPDNKLFIKSRTASCIYDPAKEVFTNAAAYLRNAGLPDIAISSIVKTGSGFYFLYADGSLYKLSDNKRVQRFGDFGKEGRPAAAGIISDIKADSKNNVLAVYRSGIVEKINAATCNVIFRTAVIQQETGGGEHDYSLFADRQDDIWLYESAMPFGAVYYNAVSNTVKRLTKENGILNNNILGGIAQDDSGMIWIGTDHGGVNIVDKKTFKTVYLKNREDDNTTLSQNVITTLYKDSTGIIWLGTYKEGINCYHENATRFPLYRHLLTDKNSLSYNDVNRFAEDAKGNIWIGTNGGGLIYFNRAENKFTQYKHDAANNNTISNDVIVSLWVDHEQKLWIGYYFGGLDCYDGRTFTHYRHDDNKPASLTEDRVWEVYEDSRLNLWIGTFNGGLDRFDRKKNIFYHYSKGSKSLSSDYISSFVEDSAGNFWVGTDDGIDVLRTGANSFTHLRAGGISNDDIISLLRDKNNNIWIGALNGLKVFNVKTGGFQSFSVLDGLPDNCILNILQDNEQKIWISTPKGLAKIIYSYNGTKIIIGCKNYDEHDGLQGFDFNENAAYKTKAGNLIFGGANGFNMFNPYDIKENKQLPTVVFTDFQLFNKTVRVGEPVKRHVILKQSISEAGEVTLNYDENVFSIEFAALGFDNAEKNKYEFKLDGFDKQWLTIRGKARRATYTNLDPGEYTFNVKASDENGLWNGSGAAIKIIVLPPFWKTSVAYLFYLTVVVCILVVARRMVIHRARSHFAIEEERKEANRLHRLDMMKIKFFTNVSHEFRTPLSLILTPLDKIILHARDHEQKKQLVVIQRNGKRLLNLVNQLLDFRKMEVQELKLNLTQGNVARFLREISYSFTDLADNKNISFYFTSNKENFIALFDHDKLERILFNLLSNAFKFTSENGIVSVNVDFTIKDGQAFTEIKVKDNGIGIPNEKQGKIFERFFQNEAPDTMLNQGSGIGLSITKEFVRLFNGSIMVESKVDNGACFTVSLPLNEVNETTNELHVKLTGATEGEKATAPNEDISFTGVPAKTRMAKNKKPIVLLVEDNEDFLFYLKDNLQEYYNIIEAGNGKKGWQKVLAEHPDIVVSDISMPVMDGIDLCKKIKADARTKHIPVILLTALAGDETHVLGLEAGAADYMTKPFNFEILLSRIRNILSGQKSLKKVVGQQVELKANKVAVESQDEKFMHQVLEIVEKNLSNPDFSVEELSKELYMSRVAVYKKIFTIAGKAPIDFIRSIRLQRAAKLLEDGNLTIAEIAYEVGFNNPKYFSKFFKAELSISPSKYAAEKKT